MGEKPDFTTLRGGFCAGFSTIRQDLQDPPIFCALKRPLVRFPQKMCNRSVAFDRKRIKTANGLAD
jgi:hypothetical protein